MLFILVETNVTDEKQQNVKQFVRYYEQTEWKWKIAIVSRDRQRQYDIIYTPI